MKSQTGISIIVILFNICSLKAQMTESSLCDFAILKKNNSPVTATYYINEFPSKKDQFYNDWMYGEITFTNGKKADSCLIRYNCWKDELIWLRETDYKTGKVIKKQVNRFTFYPVNSNGRPIVFIKYNDTIGLQQQDVFIEELVEGKISFYCYRKKTYLKSNDIFINNYQYFLKKNNILQRFNLRRPRFLAFFSKEEQKNIKKIARTNRLKLGKEDQLTKFIKLYNLSEY